MSYFAITMTDGTVAAMQTADGVTPEAAVAKWPAEQRAHVVKIAPVDAEGYAVLCRARRRGQVETRQTTQGLPVGVPPGTGSLDQLRQDLARDMAAAFQTVRDELMAELERRLAELEPLRTRTAELVIAADTLRRHAEGG